jgi:uncharacterized iron-regulated membrane protein
MSKLAWRRTWFQVHKWIGLILAVLVIPISLTGAALVWHDALDEAINPQRYAISGGAMLAPDAYVAAARAVLKPGDRVSQLAMPEHGGPVVVSAASPPKAGARGGRPQGGPPPRTQVYLDPPTARVLEVASSNGGIVRFLHVLHGSLQIPGGWGRSIVGWIGVAMMVSAFTGLWLWFPMVGKWVRGLRWRRHRNTDTNLHYLMGFWIALPLFVLSLTGAWISFPAFFAGLSGQGTGPRGGPGGGGGPDRAAMMRARPLEAPAQGVASVIARARPYGQGAAVRSVAWPTDLTPDWTVSFAGEGVAQVKVADDSGSARAAPARGQGGVARLMRRLHDGTGMGIVWQVIIFVGGVLPAALAVTGIIMWLRARGWKKALADKQRARRAAVAAG